MHDPAEAQPDGDAPVILLVDDDDTTRAMLLSAVEGRFGHDYDVLAEPSAELAMDRLQQLRDDRRMVALLIADQWLPGEAGAAFLARSRRLHPTAQRLLMSDWGDMASVEHVVPAMVLGEIETWVGRPLDRADEEFHIVVTTALARWAHEHERGGVVLTIVGNPYDATTVGLRDGLARQLVSFRFIDAASVEGQAQLDRAAAKGPLPVVIFAGGRAIAGAGLVEVAAAIGLQTTRGDTRVDVAVIGGGPAGLAAGVYAATEGLSVTLVEPTSFGGQASSSPMIRNYLGFPAGVTGAELTARAFQQALTFGARFVVGRSATALRADGDDRVVTLDDGEELRAGTVVIATGVSYRRMGIERVEALLGRGVFYGSGAADARAMAGKRVCVVGGANSAGSAAVNLARHADHVTLLVRSGSIVETMSDYLVRELDATDNIDVRLNTEIVDAHGEYRLTGLALRDRVSGAVEDVSAAGVFILIGAEPRTAWLPAEIARDDHGFILTGGRRPGGDDGFALGTTMSGVFAAGDVRSSPVKRVAAAVGDGSSVIREIHQFRAMRQRESSAV